MLVIAVLGIGTLASLTDSARKLWDAVPSLSKPQIAGEWKSDSTDFLGWGPEFMRMELQEATAGQILGTIQFSGNGHSRMRGFPVLDAKLNGKQLSVSFENGGGGNKPDTFVGELKGNQLELVFVREGKGGVPFIARRITRASQLLDGRLGITYHDKEFADPAAGCAQMLKERNPPELFKQAEAPDEYGNVHCVGKEVDGSAGFDMYDNDVKLRLICPANSRMTFRTSAKPAKEKTCECDGVLVATGAQCVQP